MKLSPALPLLAVVSANLMFVSPAPAESVSLKADLTGAAEVPPNPSAAKGSLTATFDTNSKMLHWNGTYSGLSGAPTAGHFHGPASPGKNAGVAIPIFSGPGARTPFEGSATLTDQQASELLGGLWYVNIHTATNKAGELRGQVTK